MTYYRSYPEPRITKGGYQLHSLELLMAWAGSEVLSNAFVAA